MVPVIVNAILNEHQVVADIVAFVSHGDFPRSRLGEKQRGKILGSWVTKKMRTIAQFSIRDADGIDGHMTEPQPRMSRSSKTGSVMGSSLRHSTLVHENESMSRPQAPVKEENRNETVAEPSQTHEDEEEMHYQEILNTPGYELPDALAGSDMKHEHVDSADLPSPSPLNVRNLDGSADSPSTVVTPSHGFDFGEDFPHQSQSSSTAVPSFEVVPPSTSASQGSQGDAPPPLQIRNKGRDSLPSQQRRLSSLQAGMNSLNISKNAPHQQRHGSQSWSSIHEDNHEEDWPQEALLYQSRLGNDTPGANGNSSKPGAAF